MIIDAHAHVFPDRIADRALRGNALPGLEPRGDGKLSGLQADMTTSRVRVSCTLSVANEGRHVAAANAFAASTRGDGFVPFGTVHVDLTAAENVASLRANNLQGIKIHPLFQGFPLDHPRLWEIFEELGDSTVVIAHVGAGGDSERDRLATPDMIRRIKQQFPRLPLIACHFGGYKILDEAEEILDGVDVVLETSWPPSLSRVRPERVRRLIRRHGAERVVFGSDWPMTAPAEEIRVIDSLGLTDSETKFVLGGTMARLLGIDSPWRT